jgi:hypothetical protein
MDRHRGEALRRARRREGASRHERRVPGVREPVLSGVPGHCLHRPDQPGHRAEPEKDAVEYVAFKRCAEGRTPVARWREVESDTVPVRERPRAYELRDRFDEKVMEVGAVEAVPDMDTIRLHVDDEPIIRRQSEHLVKRPSLDGRVTGELELQPAHV